MDKNKRNRVINAVLDVINVLLTVLLIKGFVRRNKK